MIRAARQLAESSSPAAQAQSDAAIQPTVW
jgi:hypothetical protein